MELLDVAYVPEFMTNLVGGSILEDKGLYFDNQRRHLHRDGKTVGLVSRVGRHYVLEDNRDTSKGVFAAKTDNPTRAGTASEWHQLLAHANEEAIHHLPHVADGVKITDKE